MLDAAITLPGGTDGLWTLLFVPLSIVIAAVGGAIGIALTRRETPDPEAAARKSPAPQKPPRRKKDAA